MTVVDVDSGDWLPLVQEHPPAYHAASRTPGRRHLVTGTAMPAPTSTTGLRRDAPVM